MAASVPFWADGRPRIGIHTSIAGDCVRALEIAHGLGCTALQIFSDSPRMWPRPGRGGFSQEKAAEFRTRRAALRLGPLAIHANYLINLASGDARLWARSVEAFRQEILRGIALGAEYLILHPGSARTNERNAGIQRIARGLREAAQGLDLGGLRILLENTAGQGSSIGRSFEELRALRDACREQGIEPRPGVCLDTAHLFAAGYEIHAAESLQRIIEEIDRVIGLGAVLVIHVNDSKAALGSHVDRHQHVGRGKIGPEAFARILNHPRLRADAVMSDGTAQAVPRTFLLETPIDRRGDDRRNVRTLWQLMAPDAMPAMKHGAGHRVRDGFRVREGRRKRVIRKK